MRFAFIGGGNMGRAMAGALIAKGVCDGAEILVVDPDAKARERNAEKGIQTQEEIGPDVGGAQVVVLAVKPQSAVEMYSSLRPHLQESQVVISIMAGVTMTALEKGLGHGALVRVMPNTPAQVGMGMNVYFAAKAITPDQLREVEALLNACGESLAVSTEDAIDAATAISGSGPAYVFFMAEHWMNAAGRMGFSGKDAEMLIRQTLVGATELWRQSGLHPAVLRSQVTSKGGTTAAALEVFGEKGVGEGFEEGVTRAYHRAKELGR